MYLVPGTITLLENPKKCVKLCQAITIQPEYVLKEKGYIGCNFSKLQRIAKNQQHYKQN